MKKKTRNINIVDSILHRIAFIPFQFKFNWIEFERRQKNDTLFCYFECVCVCVRKVLNLFTCHEAWMLFNRINITQYHVCVLNGSQAHYKLVNINIIKYFEEAKREKNNCIELPLKVRVLVCMCECVCECLCNESQSHCHKIGCVTDSARHISLHLSLCVCLCCYLSMQLNFK